jgi:hypothetical protein
VTAAAVAAVNRAAQGAAANPVANLVVVKVAVAIVDADHHVNQSAVQITEHSNVTTWTFCVSAIFSLFSIAQDLIANIMQFTYVTMISLSGVFPVY